MLPLNPVPILLDPHTQAHADMLYDLLSESLKERPRTWRELRGALETADRALDDLDRWIKDGGPLPGPWRRAAPHSPRRPHQG